VEEESEAVKNIPKASYWTRVIWSINQGHSFGGRGSSTSPCPCGSGKYYEECHGLDEPTFLGISTPNLIVVVFIVGLVIFGLWVDS
jgi:hypothetical protein